MKLSRGTSLANSQELLATVAVQWIQKALLSISTVIRTAWNETTRGNVQHKCCVCVVCFLYSPHSSTLSTQFRLPTGLSRHPFEVSKDRSMVVWREQVLSLNCKSFSLYAVVPHCIALLFYPGAECGIVHTDLSSGTETVIVPKGPWHSRQLNCSFQRYIEVEGLWSFLEKFRRAHNGRKTKARSQTGANSQLLVFRLLFSIYCVPAEMFPRMSSNQLAQLSALLHYRVYGTCTCVKRGLLKNILLQNIHSF